MGETDEQSNQAARRSENLPSSSLAFDRRSFLRLGSAAGIAALLSACKQKQASSPPPGTATTLPNPAMASATPEMARFPEKTDLILLTDRPPQLETPIKYFRQDLTPNEGFFVRWHLAGIPVSVDTKTFRLFVGGHVENALSLSLDELQKQYKPVSMVAVNQCSGNSRSLFEPRVPGGQWQNGAVGNARWTGVRLSDLLERAGVKAGAVDVSFQGLDGPVLPQTPAFVKSLGVGHAMDREVMVAYAMNDQPLPMLNGFPIRLIVPGWYATYWVKSLNQIMVLPEKFSGFWMDKAYRVPATPNMNESPASLAEKTAPISTMTVRSLIVRPEAGDRIAAREPYAVEGVAFDGGKGIVKVEVSTDNAKTWASAELDPELGRYSWRRFRYQWTPAGSGAVRIMSRATNSSGQTQATRQWNRGGYARDVIDPIEVTVA
jgi:sulfite dehydrogenase (cytochrome) subunit A